MVVAAAVAHRVPLERPQARRRLAGVGDARAGVRDLGDIAARQRRDARHPLHEVQADALGGEHGARRTRDDGEHGARLEPLAVLDDELDVDARIGQAERGGEHLASAEHPVFAGDEVGASRRRLGDEVLAREVAPRGVLLEGGGDDAVDRGAGEHQATPASTRAPTGVTASGSSAPSRRKCAPTRLAPSERRGRRRFLCDEEQVLVLELGFGAR